MKFKFTLLLLSTLAIFPLFALKTDSLRTASFKNSTNDDLALQFNEGMIANIPANTCKEIEIPDNITSLYVTQGSETDRYRHLGSSNKLNTKNKFNITRTRRGLTGIGSLLMDKFNISASMGHCD